MGSFGAVKFKAIGVTALLLAFASAPALAGVAEGNAAWMAGDFNKAVIEWRPDADAGVPEAQFNLGQAYKLGRGVTMNLAEAEKWYRKSAQLGFADAQDLLGLMLFRQGDRKEAMMWIEKSAARGEPRAMYVLGTAKFNGDFAAKDWPGAYALMTKASAAGIPQAKQSLDQMERYLTPQDKAAAGVTADTRLAQNSQPPASPRVPQGTGYTPVNPAAAPAPAPAQVAAAAPAYQPPYQAPPMAPPPPPAADGPTVNMDGASVAVPGPEVNVRASSVPGTIQQVPVPGSTAAPAPVAPPRAAPPAYVPPAYTPPPPAPVQVAEAPAPRPAPPKPAPRPAGTGPWKIQLGAFATPGGAKEAWLKLSGRVGMLQGLRYAPQAAGSVTRLQAAGVASKAEAQRICRAVVAVGNGCFPVAP
ncbi:SPOR domain-containing protein [Sphingomonas naphthae]|uniref:SPOR domain-containing protein n=1 Tax=Sphingomonas naphthae TaxID=1813468 RepID=A0ABY7TKA0_9SPHN|nr:SPOR domain-containing protein [Sphingomonas naphthae]WCT73386.1 SPOR domain-containing protein [Sphingomonas naphthae]